MQELEKNLKQLCETPMGRRAFLASMGLLLAGCQTTTSDRRREGDNSGQNTSLTVEDEKKMTQEVLPQSYH